MSDKPQPYPGHRTHVRDTKNGSRTTQNVRDINDPWGTPGTAQGHHRCVSTNVSETAQIFEWHQIPVRYTTDVKGATQTWQGQVICFRDTRDLWGIPQMCRVTTAFLGTPRTCQRHKICVRAQRECQGHFRSIRDSKDYTKTPQIFQGHHRFFKNTTYV